MKLIQWQWGDLDTLQLDPSKPVFADTETFNKSKFYKGKFYGNIRLVQLMQEGWSHALTFDMLYGGNAGKYDKIEDIFFNYEVIGQNFAYDYSTLQEVQGNRLKRIDLNKYKDTLIYARELYPHQKSEVMKGRYSLDDTYLNVLGYDPYCEANGITTDKLTLQKSKWGSMLTAEMLNYAAIDVFYLPELWNAMKEQEQAQLAVYTPEQQQAYFTRIHNAHLAVDIGLVMQSVGLVLDSEEGANYYERYVDQADHAWNSLLQFGIPENFNPTSAKQVTAFTGLPASDKVTLKFAIHRDKNEIVQHIMDYRQGMSRSNTVKKWAELVQEKGRVYGHYQPTTSTGRFSSSQENMQNQPRDSKSVFKAPDGAILIGFDYAQIELRTMCALTGDERMYDVFTSGGDIHQNTKDMCNISERSIAKQVNFGNLYGMGVKKFQEILIKEDIYLPEEELKFIKDRFLATYQRIPEYHQQGIRNTQSLTPNYSLLGHPYYSKFYNQMNNMANQASGTSEVAKMFFNLADRHDLIASRLMQLAVQIHDSNLFYFYGEDKFAEHFAYAVGILAQKSWFTSLDIGYRAGTSKYRDIPMPVEVGVSTHWKSVDDNIVVDLKGTEYLDNPDGIDAWLKDFTAMSANLIRKELI